MMKRLTALTASALLLTACGFTPMHAPKTASGDTPFKNIRVELIEASELTNQEGGYWVLQSLQDRLGTDGQAHILTVDPVFTRKKLGINSRDIATRYDMIANVSYELTDAKTGDRLDRGKVTATSSFSAPNDPYSRSVAEQTAVRNVSKSLSDRVITRLAAYYGSADKPKTKAKNDT